MIAPHARVRTVFAIVLALLGARLGAQKPARGMPALGAPKDFSFPVRRDLTLPNGMRVTLVPFGSMPKVAIYCIVRTGRIDESGNEIALADVMSDLMKEGTTTLSATQIAQRVARLGGTLTVAAGDDQTQIGGEVLSEYAAEFVHLVAQVVRTPLLPESELARVIRARVSTVERSKAEPYWLAQEQLLGALYGDHRYGRLFPTAAMLQSYSIDQVRAFHSRNVNATRAHFYVVGVFNPGAVEEMVHASFDDWPAGVPPEVHVPSTTPRGSTVVVHRPAAVQSTIELGIRVPNPTARDFSALELTDALLGGTLGSRITTNLRTRNGFTYNPSSGISRRRATAHWMQQADVTTRVTGAALREIFAEIRRLRSETPPNTEVEGVRNNMIGSFMLRNASRNGIVTLLADAELQGLGASYLTGYVRRLLAVSPDDVRKIAVSYFDPDQMTLVLVGDTTVISTQIDPYRRPPR